MSSKLMWKPVEDAQGSLSTQLKSTLSRRLWDTDGSCGGGVKRVDRGTIPYLEGLIDAGIKGASELIELIEEHGEIELWHEY